MNSFEQASIGAFGECYPAAPARLRHALSDHPLFAMERLVDLAKALPAASVEYNSGDLPLTQDPAKTPMNGLSPEETVRRIAENKSWIVLKNIEQHADYRALIEAALGDIDDAVRPHTGAMHRCEGFIFVSSPGAVTPFHMDPEHNILLQIAGEKIFTIYPADSIVSDEAHEAFYAPSGHRNLTHDPVYDAEAFAHVLTPGDALYVPVKAPHWVKVGEAVSVSLSITWRSRASDDEALLRRGNGWLRARGLNPPRPGSVPWRDRAVALARRAGERLARSR